MPVRWVATAGSGLKAAALSIARLIGPYEICEAAIGIGAYLVAREYFAVAPAAGIALILGAGLACLVNLLTDLCWTKHVEGSRR